MNRIIYTFALIFIFTVSTSVTYSANPSLRGIITDAKTGSALAGVTVTVENTPYGTITDENGLYVLRNIRQGEYHLLISYIGYKAKKVNVNIESGKTAELNESLAEEVIQTGEIVVSAVKRVQAVQEVPISVSVINNLALQQRNITKIDDALQYVPGVSMNGEDVSIRGSAGYTFGLGSRVTLLLDGIPMLSGDLADIKLGALPFFNIDRIEVVKGAGSALYGTSALGGVINIISKEPGPKAEIKSKAFASIYTEPRYKQWKYSDRLYENDGFDLGYSQKLGDLSLLLHGSYYLDESYRKYDDSRRYSAYTKFGYDFSDYTKVKLTFNFSEDDAADWVYWNSLDSATFPSAPYNPNIRFVSGNLAAMGELKQILNADNFMFLRFNYYHTYHHTNHKKDDPEYRQSKANSVFSEAQLNSSLGDNFLLTSGANLTLNDVNSNTFGIKNQVIISAYTQGELTYIENLTVNAGARVDFDVASGDQYNTELSPKIGLMWKSPWQLNIRASAGKGFRSPSIAERFASVDFQGFVVKQNPMLKPEKSISFELGANYDGMDYIFGIPLNIDMCFFVNSLSDLIEPVIIPEETGTIQFRNVTRAKVTGFETVIRTYFPGLFGFETGFTYIDPIDETLNKTLKYRSKILWYNRAIFQMKPLEFQVDFRYMSRFDNIDNELAFQVEDFDARVDAFIVDARLIWNMEKLLGNNISLILNARNLFDYYYTEMAGNLAPTRNISLQINALF